MVAEIKKAWNDHTEPALECIANIVDVPAGIGVLLKNAQSRGDLRHALRGWKLKGFIIQPLCPTELAESESIARNLSNFIIKKLKEEHGGPTFFINYNPKPNSMYPQLWVDNHLTPAAERSKGDTGACLDFYVTEKATLRKGGTIIEIGSDVEEFIAPLSPGCRWFIHVKRKPIADDVGWARSRGLDEFKNKKGSRKGLSKSDGEKFGGKRKNLHGTKSTHGENSGGKHKGKGPSKGKAPRAKFAAGKGRNDDDIFLHV